MSTEKARMAFLTMAEAFDMEISICRMDDHRFCVSTSARMGGTTDRAK